MCAASFWEVLVLPGFSRPSAAAGRSSAGSPHGFFHPNNQALGDAGTFYKDFLVCGGRGLGRLNGTGCHCKGTCVKTTKDE